MSFDRSKISRFKVISSENPGGTPEESFSFSLRDPKEFDLQARPLGDDVYEIGQKISPTLSSQYTSLISDRRNEDIRWAGISRCGRYAVSFSDKSLRVVSGISDEDRFMVYHPLSAEDIETHLSYLIRDDGDPLIAASFVSGYHEVFLKRPKALMPDDTAVGNLLDRLYFQFTLVTRDDKGDEIARAAFEIPIMKTYGTAVLQLATLHDAIVALQAAWLVKFDGLEQIC